MSFNVCAWRLGVVRRRTAQKGGRDFLAAIVERKTCCLRKLGGGRAEEVRFGRFLRNDAVTKEEMLRTAGAATGLKAGARHVLVIQDTSELNFSSHGLSKNGFGTVGNGVDTGNIPVESNAAPGSTYYSIERTTEMHSYSDVPLIKKIKWTILRGANLVAEFTESPQVDRSSAAADEP